MRLALVCGLAEMLTVAAIRDATPEAGPVTLCLYGAPISMPPDLRRQSLEDATLFGPWAEVIDAVDRTPDEALAELQPSAILSHTLGGGFETAVFAQFPQADLVFFDNGLGSHVDVPVLDEPVAGQRGIARATLARVACGWFSLARDLPTPKHLDGVRTVAIPPESLRAAAAEALVRMPAARRPNGGPARLILGTSFYRTSAIDHPTEQRIYRACVDALRAASDAPILYKEHPRASEQPLLGEDDGLEIVSSRLPIEIWAEAREITEAYSISSTALLSLRRLYGARPFVLASTFEFPRAMRHIALMRQAVEPFEP